MSNNVKPRALRCLIKWNNATFDAFFPSGFANRRVGVLSKLPLAAAILGRADAVRALLPNQLNQPEAPPLATTSPASGPLVHSDSDQPGESGHASLCFRAKSFAGLRRASITGWKPSTQILVDGYEQLGWLQRTWLKWQCRRRGAGLLVTAHDDVGLPPLWQTETSAELTQRVVARLLGESDAEWLDEDHVERLLATQRGNLREVLFALYDLYEQHQRR